MTDIELKDRLSASVDEIEAAPELLDRVRQGGGRRLRRRRLTALAACTLAVLAVGGVAVTGPGLYQSMTEPPVAGMPVQGDPYGFLMKGHTRGDLAEDQAYLDEVVLAWQKSHRDSQNRERGIFDHLQGEPRVYWAGKTPAGRVAIVAQYAELRHHDNIQLDREGVYTLVGFVADGADGKPAVQVDSYPAPGVSLQTGFVTGNTLIVLDTKRKVGWSPGREYHGDGSSGRTYQQVAFKDGVGVVHLPENTNPHSLALHTLPAEGPSDLAIANAGVDTPRPGGGAVLTVGDGRLWADIEGDALWPMSPNAEHLSGTARETFSSILGPLSDPVHYQFGDSLWNGYGVTADGSAVYVGEQQIDADPSRVYVVLKPKDAKARTFDAGVPARDSALPVRFKLPAEQGWVIAARGQELSYRYGDGAWSAPRQNALLVPHGANVSVQVTNPDGSGSSTVTLR